MRQGLAEGRLFYCQEASNLKDKLHSLNARSKRLRLTLLTTSSKAYEKTYFTGSTSILCADGFGVVDGFGRRHDRIPGMHSPISRLTGDTQNCSQPQLIFNRVAQDMWQQDGTWQVGV